MQLRKGGAVVVGAAMLGGCAGAEVILAVAQVVNVTTMVGAGAYEIGKEATSVQYRVRYEGKVDREKWDTRMDMAKTVQYMRVWWREDGKCSFEGVLVPWSDPQAEGEDALKVAGYASVIYSRKCPEQAEQSVLLIGKQEVYTRKNTTTLSHGQAVQTMDLFDNPVEARPIWWPQVAQRLLTLAPTDAAALRFVQHAQDNLVRLMPEQEAAIRAAAAGPAAEPATAPATETVADAQAQP